MRRIRGKRMDLNEIQMNLVTAKKNVSSILFNNQNVPNDQIIKCKITTDNNNYNKGNTQGGGDNGNLASDIRLHMEKYKAFFLNASKELSSKEYFETF